MSLFSFLSSWSSSRLSAITLPILLLICGCQTGGLSVREQPGDFSVIALSLHDTDEPNRARSAPQPVQLPAKLAVVQLGEVAPPQDMIEALRTKRETFADVQAVPSAFNRYNAYAPAYHGKHEGDAESWVAAQKKVVRDQVDSMRQFARDGGADYLLLFGGTVDQATTSTPLGVFDLTIIGLFIVPSKQVSAEARAGATLIDIRTGRSVMTLNSQSKGTRMAPAASTEHAQLKLAIKLRDELTKDLTNQLSERMQRLSSSNSRS